MTAVSRTCTASNLGRGLGRGWHEASPIASQSHGQTGFPESLVAKRAQHVEEGWRRVPFLQARAEERPEILVESNGRNDLRGGIRPRGFDLQARRETWRWISPAVEQREIDDPSIEVVRCNREFRALRC